MYDSGRSPVDFSMFKNGSIANMEALMKLLQKDENTISYEMTDIRNNPDYIRYEGEALGRGDFRFFSPIFAVIVEFPWVTHTRWCICFFWLSDDI